MKGLTISRLIYDVLLILILATSLNILTGNLYADSVPEVEVNLNSGSFLNTLPFDSHFKIKGKISNRIKKVTIWFRKMDGPNDKKTFSNKTQGEWSKLAPWVNHSESSNNYFYVFFDKFLEAKSYYRFHFRYETELDDSKRRDIINLIRNWLDEKLKKHKNPEKLLSKISEELKKELEKIEIPEKFLLDIPSNSVFYGGPAGNTALKEMMDDLMFLQRIETLQMKRIDKINEFREDQNVYSDYLVGDYFNNPALDKIIKLIKKAAKEEEKKNETDSERMEFFKKMKSLIELLFSLDKSNSDKIVTGLYDLKVGQTWIGLQILMALDEYWDQKAPDKRMQNMQTTSTSLAEIKKFLMEVKEDQHFLSHDSVKLEKEEIDCTIKKLNETQEDLYVMFNHLWSLKNILKERTALLDELIKKLKLRLESEVTALGMSYGDLSTRAMWYFSSDIGVAYALKIKEILPYYGVNIYLRPINRNTPLRQLNNIDHYKNKPLKKLGYRFSFLLGVTKNSIEETGQRKGISGFGDKAILAGIGFRLTDLIKINGGSLLFHDIDPNPLISKKRDGIAYDIFVSLSVDWNIEKTISSLLKLVMGQT